MCERTLGLTTSLSKPIAMTAMLLACSAALAEPVSYVVDPKHTYAMFEINHLGLSTARGTFDRTSGDIVLDAAAGTGHIEIVIDTASIDTGLDKRDEHLRAPEFFNVEQYPTMKFVATSLMFDGDRLVKADGSLTMLGKTLPVSLRTIPSKNMPPLTRIMVTVNSPSDMGNSRLIIRRKLVSGK